MPKVSVIVPNYNHAPYLKQRIDSILNQTYQDFELILLDDCSTDNSRDILLSYKDNPHVTQIVFNEQNGGSPFAQWNKGIELAQGEWIWIAESDDWADPLFLDECMLGILNQQKEVGVVVTPVTYYKNGKTWRCNTYGEHDTPLYYDGKFFIQQFLSVECLLTNVSSMLFKKVLLDKLDYKIFVSMKLCGDWLFYVQVLAQTNICILNKSLSMFRRHAGSTALKQETLGVGMIEGAYVLRYMLDNQYIDASTYKKAWIKKWWRNQNDYHYTRAINKDIMQTFKCYSLQSLNNRYLLYRAFKYVKTFFNL